MLLLDTLMWMIDGRPGRIFRILSSGAMVAYNALNPVICLLWYLYVDFYIFGSRKRMRSYMHFLLIPVTFNLVLSVVSVFGNIYFVLDEYNTYHRGKYIIILMIICLIYVIATSLLLFVNRKRMTFKEFPAFFCWSFSDRRRGDPVPHAQGRFDLGLHHAVNPDAVHQYSERPAENRLFNGAL